MPVLGLSAIIALMGWGFFPGVFLIILSIGIGNENSRAGACFFIAGMGLCVL